MAKITVHWQHWNSSAKLQKLCSNSHSTAKITDAARLFRNTDINVFLVAASMSFWPVVHCYRGCAGAAKGAVHAQSMHNQCMQQQCRASLPASLCYSCRHNDISKRRQTETTTRRQRRPVPEGVYVWRL